MRRLFSLFAATLTVAGLAACDAVTLNELKPGISTGYEAVSYTHLLSRNTFSRRPSKTASDDRASSCKGSFILFSIPDLAQNTKTAAWHLQALADQS